MLSLWGHYHLLQECPLKGRSAPREAVGNRRTNALDPACMRKTPSNGIGMATATESCEALGDAICPKCQDRSKH